MVGIGGEIDEQVVVDKRLRPRAYVPAARLLGAVTVVAVAEYGGPALRRGGAEIPELHSLFHPFGLCGRVRPDAPAGFEYEYIRFSRKTQYFFEKRLAILEWMWYTVAC